MVPEALAAFDQERVFAGETPTTRAKRAHVLAATGHIDQAREILAEIIRERNEKWVTAYEIAIVYSLLNHRDNAFLWRDTADQEHAVSLTFARAIRTLTTCGPTPFRTSASDRQSDGYKLRICIRAMPD
jgi:hypothetical protein